MNVSSVMAKSVGVRSPLQRFIAALKPLENAQKEIRSLDGLRAVAALSIVLYHLCLVSQFKLTPIGSATANYWGFLTNGVRLFFVLSGFLLFLPYARAMLRTEPLPSAFTFYKRRALRILPAYYVCLAIVAILPTSMHLVPLSLKDVLTHLTFIHDAFPFYNRDLDGPFWTLAVEVQFYLLLPIFAAVMARVVGTSRSYIRLIGCIVTLIIVALVVHVIDGVLMGHIPAYTASSSLSIEPARLFVQVTYGMQGKFLEVFGAGMLCAVIYVVTVEMHRLPTIRLRQFSWVLFPAALCILFLAAGRNDLSEAMFFPHIARSWVYGFYSLIVGVGFGILLLAILSGGRIIRFVFEWAPLRYIGLISFSLYLWHLPALNGSLPIVSSLSLPLRVGAAFVIAYALYQLVERPFLRRRRSYARKSQPELPAIQPVGSQGS